MASAGKSQLLSFMDELIPTIRTALCDSMPEVRESAGLAFSTLYKEIQSAGSHKHASLPFFGYNKCGSLLSLYK
nr:isoform 2 of protein ilityhia [Quercus suber]